MSATVLMFAAVVAAFAAVIAGTLALHQRRTAQRLRALLATNEQSRRALAEQLVSLREQLEAGRDPLTEGDVEQRRAELDRLLAASAVADGPWQDTMPSVLMEFAPTEPATITEARRRP
jgi:predicted dinucleotide-binding enzyme